MASRRWIRSRLPERDKEGFSHGPLEVYGQASEEITSFYMHYSGVHYNGAGGIHDTLITRSAHNTILDYDNRIGI
jgi:hypothetical protein